MGRSCRTRSSSSPAPQVDHLIAENPRGYIHGDLIKVDGGETLCRYSVCRYVIG
jgi:hypothetical protein